MKKTLLIITIACAGLALTACSDEKKTEKSFDDFREYVNERSDSAERYFDKEWEELEREYTEKRMKAEERVSDWSDEMKAEFASLQSDWEMFKEDYLADRARRENMAQTEVIMTQILPEGINEDLSNVTAANILNVHTHFVNYVDTHKDQFTREQWDRVELVWEALGTRKNQIEKEIEGNDNLKIAEQKVKYGAIKAVNRPGLKAEENAGAKKE